MSDDAQEWRWVSEDGVEKAVAEQELIAELSSEALPHYTLVWKKCWLEWLPAMQVAELGWALPPGKAERAVRARESASALNPPAPPLYLYPVIKRRAGIARDASAERAGPPRPATAPRAANAALEAPTNALGRSIEDVEIDAIAASSPASGGPPSSTSSRSPPSDDEVTLVADGDFVSDRAASHAQLEPARAPLGRTAYAEEDDGDTHVLASRPPPGPVYVGPHSPPPSEAPGPTYDENEIPHIPRPPASPTDLSYGRFSESSELELEDSFPRKRRRHPALAVSAAAAVGIGAALFVLHGFRSEAKSPAEEASARAAASARGPGSLAPTAKPREERPKGPPCTVVTPAVRVAGWAEPLVPPMLAAIPGSGRLALGFAQSDTYAIGMTVDPRTLDRDQVFREFRREKLVSVVPTSASGKLHFDVVRQGLPLANARAVDAPTPFVLGATPFSIARLERTDEPIPVWALADAQQSTLPRVLAIPGPGYAVAFRRGTKNGTVSVGYLDKTGNKATELTDVRSDGAAGTPAIAADESSLLVAFASRASATAPWGIAAGTAKLGEAPRKALRVKLHGGPSGDQMAPAVGALGGGRWFLQWTEGTAGNRVAHGEVLDRALVPITDPANLSPDGANAGQGVVWTSGDLATILFFVKNDKSNNELWGVALECPR